MSVWLMGVAMGRLGELFLQRVWWACSANGRRERFTREFFKKRHDFNR